MTPRTVMMVCHALPTDSFTNCTHLPPPSPLLLPWKTNDCSFVFFHIYVLLFVVLLWKSPRRVQRGAITRLPTVVSRSSWTTAARGYCTLAIRRLSFYTSALCPTNPTSEWGLLRDGLALRDRFMHDHWHRSAMFPLQHAVTSCST